MLKSYSKIINSLLKDLPENDYPVLNTKLWVECWFHFTINQSLSSMRDLISYLNICGIKVDISTFSRANQNRNAEIFPQIYQKLVQKLSDKRGQTKKQIKEVILALDTTVVTLTSKLLHLNNYQEVKLLCSQNSETNIAENIGITLTKTHDCKMFSSNYTELESTGIVVMDRAFSSTKLIKNFQDKSQLFVIRIKKSITKILQENGEYLLGIKNPIKCRLISFCSLENKKEYYLATNLPLEQGNQGFNDEEIAEIYRKRWATRGLLEIFKTAVKIK
jgi:putative transposase